MNQLQMVNAIPENVYHSSLGEYFFGQTDLISFGAGKQGWGALVNPSDSQVNLFLNAYTITNFSDEPITAEGWLDATLPGTSVTSQNFAAGNQAMTPPSVPKVLIQSASMTSGEPAGGSYTFVRRVEPAITLTKHDFQGMYIIPPGSSFALFFLSPGNWRAYTRVAWGWWEEKTI